MAGPANSIILNAVSATSTQNSAAISADRVLSCSFSITSSSASNSGTLQIQVSDDTFESLGASNAPAPVNWFNAPGSNAAPTVTSGAAALAYIVPNNYPGFRWLRAVWTPSSGVGTITVTQFLTVY